MRLFFYLFPLHLTLEFRMCEVLNENDLLIVKLYYKSRHNQDRIEIITLTYQKDNRKVVFDSEDMRLTIERKYLEPQPRKDIQKYCDLCTQESQYAKKEFVFETFNKATISSERQYLTIENKKNTVSKRFRIANSDEEATLLDKCPNAAALYYWYID